MTNIQKGSQKESLVCGSRISSQVMHESGLTTFSQPPDLPNLAGCGGVIGIILKELFLGVSTITLLCFMQSKKKECCFKGTPAPSICNQITLKYTGYLPSTFADYTEHNYMPFGECTTTGSHRHYLPNDTPLPVETQRIHFIGLITAS